MECPPTVSRAACQTTGALWHRDLPDFCFRVRKNRKMLEKGDLFSCIRFARVFHSRVQNPTLPFFPSFTQFPQGFPQPFALFHRGGGGNVGNSGFPDRFSDNGKENGVFSAPRYLADRFVDHAGDQWSAPRGHRLRRGLTGSRLTLGGYTLKFP